MSYVFSNFWNNASLQKICKDILPFIAVLTLLTALTLFFLIIPLLKKKIINLKRISIERFGSFLNESRYCVVIFDLSGNPTYVNKAFCEYWELNDKTKSLFLEKYNIFKDQCFIKMQFEDMVRKAFSGIPQTLPNFMYSLRESSNYFSFVPDKKMWTRIHFYPVKDENGKNIEIVMLVDNISGYMNSEVEKIKLIYELEIKNFELNSALVKADEANRLKSEFLAVMSHELRTPISAMLGFSQLLLNDRGLEASQKENADYINKSADRLLCVLNDILEISIIEAGKLELKYEELDVKKVVEDVYYLFKETFDKKGIAFSSDFNGIEKIVSVESRLRQILFNIIGNAVKFTEKGSVALKLENKNGSYIFSVKDTGIGIEKENREIIFDIFRQVEGNLNRSFTGTGLGLSISRKLIEALEGKIWLESQKGKGSTFYFKISSTKQPGETKVYRGKNFLREENLNREAKILFAEDDELNRAYLSKAISLKRRKYMVKAVSNGIEVLDELKRNPEYNVVILDIKMPVMGGVECLNNIRKIDKNIPVIAVSAYASQKDFDKYLDLGFSDYASKPVSEEDMIEKIERIIGRPDSDAQLT